MFRETPKYSRLFSWWWRSERNPLRNPQDAAAKFYSITLHPKGAARKWAGKPSGLQQLYESKGIAGCGSLEPGALDAPLDNSRDNEYYAGMAPSFRRRPRAPALQLGAPRAFRRGHHDQHSQEQRTRPRRSRLAEHPFHVFFRRLL